MEQENKILTGTIWKQILIFFFPILIGTFFQQLYNTVDAIVVGRFAGKQALSAVGGSSAIIISLIVGFFTGLGAGCTVLIAQFYGAKKDDDLDIALHTSYLFSVVGGLISGVIAIWSAPWILKLMNTPDELMADSLTYMRIYFAGLIFVFVYNMGSSILRALGDSKRPLYYLIVCSIVNIVFDLIFVIVFKWGVFGVAFATLLSQIVSAVLVTYCLMFKCSMVKLDFKKMRMNKSMLGHMLKIGLPTGIQSSTYSISNIIIQSAINLFGVNAMAGWTAEGKVDVIFWMINNSFGIAATTFVGQNYGAGNFERVKKGTRTCLYMALGTALVVTTLLLTCGKYMLMLFTTDAEVIDMGVYMLNHMVPGYFLFVFIEIFTSSLRARGNTFVPTIINIVAICGFRIIWIFSLGTRASLGTIILCYPISWAICLVPLTLYYFKEGKVLAR